MEINGTVVSKVRVTLHQNDRVAFQGSVDLGPTLARAAANLPLGRGNDGGPFGGGGLPKGNYTEWYHEVPGHPDLGGMRVITSTDGRAFFSPDHYQTFLQVRWSGKLSRPTDAKWRMLIHKSSSQNGVFCQPMLVMRNTRARGMLPIGLTFSLFSSTRFVSG
jgi:hypothetical protein